jgi:hypothetical protein
LPHRRSKKKKRPPPPPKPSSSSSASSSSEEQDDAASDTNSSETSSSSAESARPPPQKKKKPAKKRSKKKKKSRTADADSDDSLAGYDDKERERIETLFEMCNDFWAYEDRPPSLQKRSVVGRHTLNELSGLKRDIAEEQNKRNLGEDVFTRDSKVPKTKYKKMTDDSKKRFHPARWNRQPLVPPSVYFKYIPKKRSAIVRNFPTEHYGVSGQISETTIGHLHNRSVKVTLDSFCKASYKPARAGEKAGKYLDAYQLMEGIVNYCIMLHAIWPNDYTGLVILKVLCEARWGDTAGLTGR